VPPLLVLDAQVEVASASGTRMVPLAEFITGVRKVDLRAQELVSAIFIPSISDEAQSAFSKLGSRTHLVISIAMVGVVARVQTGKIADVRIAVGSCSPVAQRLHALEARIEGQSVEDIAQFDFAEVDVLSPISDVRGSAEYRLDVVSEMCRRAVLDACRRG
jgi:CO/xanthine dehydrogenase FAD-binding subunit